MAGEVVHYEFPSEDADRAQRFWSGLFGWTFRDSGMPGMDYRMAQAGDRAAAAVYRSGAGRGTRTSTSRRTTSRRRARRCANSAARPTRRGRCRATDGSPRVATARETRSTSGRRTPARAERRGALRASRVCGADARNDRLGHCRRPVGRRRRRDAARIPAVPLSRRRVTALDSVGGLVGADTRGESRVGGAFDLDAGQPASQRGRYQLRRPSRTSVLGRTTERISVASSSSATATPKPICWNMHELPARRSR